MSVERLDACLRRAESLLERLDARLPRALPPPDWERGLAFRWRPPGSLFTVRRLDPIRLDNLRGIDRQRRILERNTLQFLQGLPANNALLWGARGTGKSSLIKAMLNAHAGAGLRVVEVDAHDLVALPDIAALLEERPEHFIIFCDDLSFEADDPSYKALKAMLDGSVCAPADNMLIYATSNRRHLMPEFMSENRSARLVEEELHHGEAVEEKISLSERFGLWVSFHPFDQNRYLEIVSHWIQALGGPASLDEDTGRAALEWALTRGSRSGRVAAQFARDWWGAQQLNGSAAELSPGQASSPR